MKYHPIAQSLVQILEQNTTRYIKDFYEISHIQSAEGSAEKFAAVSVTTFIKNITRDISKHFKGTLYIPNLFNTIEAISPESPTSLKLLLTPMEGFTNYTRGLPYFGVSFLLQEEKDGKLCNVFALLYNFSTQEVIYSAEGASYIKGRNIKPIVRKQPKFAVISCNTNALKGNPNIVHKFKQVQVSNSLIYDFHLLAKGKIDGIYYERLPLNLALACLPLAKTLNVWQESAEIEISNQLSSKAFTAFFTNPYIKKAITNT